MLRHFVTYKAGVPTGSGLKAGERERENYRCRAAVSASEWGILLLLSTWKGKRELI